MVWNDVWYWCRKCTPHRRFASFNKLKQHRKEEHSE